MKLLEYLNKDLSDKEEKSAIAENKTRKFKAAKSENVKSGFVEIAKPVNLDFAETSGEVKGLTADEAKKRLSEYGENVLSGGKKIHPIGLFLAQYKDIMTMILLVCTAISVFMGEYVEAISIAIIVLMNGVLGFIQEFKTEKTLNALKEMAAPTAHVYRDNVLNSIPARDIVPGDVIKLSAGDKIPADSKILEATMLECDESMLSGESIPVKKSEGDSIYMGCIITSGHAEVKAEKTGMATQMGGIAKMLSGIEEEATPLSKKLAQLSKYIAAGCLAVCAIVSITGILRGEKAFDMLITGVSLAVAAVPEGLPAIVTISLALSVSRMVKRNALVRKLHAVETLGCATVICSDKTGTITQNKMTATALCTFDNSYKARELDISDETVAKALCGITLCNNAEISEGVTDGSHTELALLELAAKYNFTRKRLSEGYKRLDERPFDSKRKMMSVLCEEKTGKRYIFAKGAYDILLNKSKFIMTNQGIVALTPAHKKVITEKSDYLASSALRIIGICFKQCDEKTIASEDSFVFLAVIGMIDPPRPEVRPAVLKCTRAGIRTIMITGDHQKTALAIAKNTGIFKDGDIVLTGAELSSMSDEELYNKSAKASVYARVSPEHKLRIVKALKKRGEIVAMTGDGVNDAPAVKEADIGVSMGISGTDVTKEAAQIILLDDNFATLVNAVDEGRSIYGNIRKFIRYLLSCNIGEVLTMFVGMLMGMPTVLLPIQILLVNLVTDGLPAIALGLEPSDKRAMKRPPRKPDESVFSGGLYVKIIIRGIFIGISTLLSFSTIFAMTHDLKSARSAALFALIFAQLIHVFECKDEEKTLLEINIMDNKKLIWSTLLSFVIMIAAIYIPKLQFIFNTAPLSLLSVVIVVAYCFIAPVVSILIHRKRKN